MTGLGGRLLGGAGGSRLRFVGLAVVLAVALVGGLVATVLPSLTGGGLPRGDAKRVADLDRLAGALERYHEQHGGYPVSTGSCAGGRFDSDAEVAFLAELEQEAVVEAIPRDPVGTADGAGSQADGCRAMYGQKHYLYYSNGTKFALVASVDDASAARGGAGVHLAAGDRAWFDGSALLADWGWSRNVYVVSEPALAAVDR